MLLHYKMACLTEWLAWSRLWEAPAMQLWPSWKAAAELRGKEHLPQRGPSTLSQSPPPHLPSLGPFQASPGF